MSHSPNIDLQRYIQNDDIRKQFEESYIYIDADTDMKKYAMDIRYNEALTKIPRLIFSKSVLKNKFFDMLGFYNDNDITILNCNSNIDLFRITFSGRGAVLIYNNVRKCDDEEILEYINNYKGILVC